MILCGLVAGLLSVANSSLPDWSGPPERWTSPIKVSFEGSVEGGAGLFDPTNNSQLTVDPTATLHLGVRLREPTFAQWLGVVFEGAALPTHYQMAVDFGGRAIWGVPRLDEFLEFGVGVGFSQDATQNIYGIHSNFALGVGVVFPVFKHVRLTMTIVEFGMYNVENGNPVLSFRTSIGIDFVT